MRFKRKLSLFLAAAMVLTLIQAVPADASRGAEDAAPGIGKGILGAVDPSQKDPDASPIDPDASPIDPNVGEAVIEDLQITYDAKEDRITLAYKMNKDCEYVRIYANGRELETEYTGSVYDWDDVRDGMTHTFRVVPYNRAGISGMALEASYEVPYKKAELEDVDAEYNLEKQVLIVDWTGNGIAYADVYQDDVLLAQKVRDSRLIKEIKLEPESKHTYKIVPYNRIDEVGAEKSYLLEVDDYVARIDDLNIEYNEAAKQIRMQWSDTYTEYVGISLNDEELVEKYTKKDFVINCELQPGATYIVTLTPYNYKDKEGEAEETDVSVGYFEVPGDFSASLVNIPVKNNAGGYTGFSRPSVQLSWEAQNLARYEIYRAEDKDKQSGYKWIATVKSNKEGTYVYTDEKAGFGNYYYKVRRKIVEDPYVEQELYTALSDAENVNVAVPKPEVKAQLNEKGNIVLSLYSKREFVSGYDIYRKSGNGGYKLLATTTEDEYVDEDLEVGQKYQYKVKAYYYDISTGRKTIGKSSKAATVKNSVSKIEAQAVAVSPDTVKVVWNRAANVKEYEIYCRSGMQGDSYVLWKTTNENSFERKVSKNGTYYFMIKANQMIGGRAYFSSAEISIKMGFSAPSGLKIAKTSYKKSKSSNVVNQKSKLSWNRVYGAKGYYVEVYDELSKKYKRVAKIGNKNKTSYTVTNPITANAKTLKYRVSAYLGKKVKKGKTIEITPALAAAKKVKAVKSGSKVKISWKKVLGAECYRVYRSNGRTMLLIGETKSSSVLDQGLDIGIPYKYYVEAVNYSQKITGEKSEPCAFMTKQNKVAKFSAANRSAGSAQLTWASNKNAESYMIYFKNAKDAKYQKLAEVAGKEKSYTHKNLPAGTNCYYKITTVQKNSGGIRVESDGTYTEVKISK